MRKERENDNHKTNEKILATMITIKITTMITIMLRHKRNAPGYEKTGAQVGMITLLSII
jgi:hypothetical protein